MTSPIKVVIPSSKGVVTLLPSDFLASGGEGSVYRKGKQLFKIYTNTPSADLEEKINLLSQLKHELVVAPVGIIHDERQHPIGYTMPFVQGEILVKAFTNDWRNKENFTNDETLKLVERMREITQFAHDSKALIVDGNELNYLIQRDKPFIIDVDSWQIGKFRATAIMTSIKDFTHGSFTDLTDWYSWGVVTFQIFSGIHPYKGRHPDFKLGDLESRMRQHVSVFNKNTHIPQATRDFSTIPTRLREWYMSVFEEGKRSVPPLVMAGAKQDWTLAAKKYRTVQIDTTSSLTFAKVGDFPGNIVFAFPCGVVLLNDGSVFDSAGRKLANIGTTKAEIVPAPVMGYIAAFEKDGLLNILEIPAGPDKNAEVLHFTMACRKVFRKDDRLFAVNGTNLTELVLRRPSLLDNAVMMSGKTWQISNNAMFFRGVGLINALKAIYLVLPIGTSGCSIIRAKELDGYIPLEGSFDGNLITLLAVDTHADVVKFEFSMSEDFSNYTVWFGKTDLSAELNVVVKGNVAVTITEDNQLSVFSTKGGPTKVIKDKNIFTDMKLYMFKGNVHFVHEKSLWRLSM